jgi:4-hydroxybenzoate polyprenyltransferase
MGSISAASKSTSAPVSAASVCGRARSPSRRRAISRALVLPWPLAAERVVFHAIGLGYSFRLVPTLRGWRRFKDLYALKNGMSAVLFVLSVIGYPLLGRSEPLRMSVTALAALAAFFFLFEHTFEIVYDLRDLDGDRAVGVPTYPVVHGIARAATLVYALCVVSIVILVAARASRLVTTRELLMAAAPAAQLAFLRWRGPSNVTRADCIGVTYAGTVLLLVFLAGTALWERAGLPMDV